MGAIRLGNKEMLFLVDALDAFLQVGQHSPLKAEDRALISKVRRDGGMLVGSASYYEVMPTDTSGS